MLSQDRCKPFAPDAGLEAEVPQTAVAVSVAIEWRDSQAVEDERSDLEPDRRKRVLGPVRVIRRASDEQ